MEGGGGAWGGGYSTYGIEEYMETVQVPPHRTGGIYMASTVRWGRWLAQYPSTTRALPCTTLVLPEHCPAPS